MNISIQDYRVRIGLHHVSGRNCQTKFKRKPTKPSSIKLSLFLLCMILLSSFHDQNPQFKARTSPSFKKISYLKSIPNLTKDPSVSLTMSFFYNTLNWSYSTTSCNSLNHALVGNRKRLGYKLAFWNCRKGLIDKLDHDTPKLIDIKRFVEKHQPHIFGIIESNLHSANSRVNRKTIVTKKEIEEKLKIDGYRIELPDTWNNFGQARILVYVSDELNYKRKNIEQNFIDLPNVSLEIGLGRERKTLVNVFYR